MCHSGILNKEKTAAQYHEDQAFSFLSSTGVIYLLDSCGTFYSAHTRVIVSDP